MTPETDGELIGEIRLLNASIDVDKQDLAEKEELRDKYLKELSNSLGQIPWQIMKLREDGKA